MELDVAHFVLAILGLMMGLTGNQPITKDDKTIFLFILGMFVVLALTWQDAHHWIGLLSGAFVAALGTYVIAFVSSILIGLLFGYIFESYKKWRGNRQPPSRS